MYSLLETVLIVGGVCSIIILATSLLLFWWELKNSKNSNKLVKESSLEKYLRMMMIGVLLALAFGITIEILRLF